MSELRNEVRELVQRIYDDAQLDGYVRNDDICDELGDYFDDVQDSSDDVLKQAYELARSAHEVDYSVAMQQLKAAVDLLTA